MYYTLTYKNRPVIEESKLGVLIENQLFESALGIPNDTCHFWCENLKLTGTEHQKTDERWKPVYGERAEVRDCYNEMTLKFKKGEGKGNRDGGYDKRKNYFMNIIVRAYNEGVTFRYHFPETGFSCISSVSRLASQCLKERWRIMNVGHKGLMNSVRWKDGAKRRVSVL